jgi:tRNA dimethylallyltransferase
MPMAASSRTIVLVGPTAVGKSAVALELAPRLNAEIVSADSMQIYRGLDIGTAKPTAAERAATPHHLIDICDISEMFDVKRFTDRATRAIADIHARGKTALIVGGTGLYVRALRHGLFEGPARDAGVRDRLEKLPADALFAELQSVDPQTAGKIDRRNPRRLVRALEVFYATGKPIRQLQTQWGTTASETLAPPTAGGATVPVAIGLNRDRADLYARIERRIDSQLAAGWLDEVRALLQENVTPVTKLCTAWQAAGYRELAAHLRGELALDAAVALIKTRTRQLAKRQLTWFRREPDLVWLAVGREEPPATTMKRVWEIATTR